VLASWFRLKYPHVAVGALASSAPILQFDYITPWTSFYDAVSQDYKVSTTTTLSYFFSRKKKKDTLFRV
jgi:lysosomal Pro-X carboxypeptidase